MIEFAPHRFKRELEEARVSFGASTNLAPRELLSRAQRKLLRDMAHDHFDPEYVFSHHHATPEKLAKYERIHAGAKDFANVLLQHVPDCEDRIAVLQLLREASMLACAAVTLEGRLR